MHETNIRHSENTTPVPEPTPPTDPAVNSREMLLGTLRRLALLPSGAIDEVAARPDCQGSDPKPIGRHLFLNGYLTRYQLNQAAAGRDDDLVVGPYALLDKIAEGGAGQVFRARHRVMNRIVALKRIRPEMLARPELVARFFQEAQVAAQLDHPNLVRAFDAGQAGKSCFLVMEYVEGIDLTRLVKEGGPLGPATACEFARQTALALDHAHDRGLVHRDVKPSNILVTPFVRDADGRPRPGPAASVKLLDLGLARWHADGSSDRGPSVGSPHFVAPEQIRNAEASDIRADLYSLGATLFYLVTGQTPFAGTAQELVQAHATRPAPRIESVRPGLPAALGDVIDRLLQKDPAARYQTPSELADALGKLTQSLTVERPAIVSPPAPAAGRPTVPELSELSFDDDTNESDSELREPATGRRVALAYRPPRAQSGNRTLYLMFGVGLHVAAFAIVGAILLWKYGRSDARDEPPRPKAQAKVLIPERDQPKTDVAPVPDLPKPGPTDPPPAKTTVTPKVREKSAPPRVAFARGAPPEGKPPLDTANVLPARRATAFPATAPVLNKLPDARPSDVRSLAVPSGEKAPLVVVDARIRLIDPQSGKDRGSLPGGPAEALEINPNGVLACGLVGGKLTSWTLDPPGPGQPPTGDPGGALCLAHSPNGSYVLTGGADGVVRVWELIRGEVDRSLTVGDPVTALAVAPNGWLAVVGTAGGSVSFWDLESQKRLSVDARHQGEVVGLSVAPDGRECISTGADGRLIAWQLTDGAARAQLEEGEPGGRVSWVGSGWGLVASRSGRLLCVNMAERRTIVYGDDGMGKLQAFAVSPDGRTAFASFSLFGIGRLDFQSPAAPVNETPVPDTTPPPKAPGEKKDKAGAPPSRPTIADARPGRVTPLPQGATACAVRFTNDGQMVVVGTVDGRLLRYPANGGEPTAVADSYDAATPLWSIAGKMVSGAGFVARNDRSPTKHETPTAVTACGVSGRTPNDTVILGTASGAVFRVRPGVPNYRLFWQPFEKPIQAIAAPKEGQAALAVVDNQLYSVDLDNAGPKAVPIAPVTGKVRHLEWTGAGAVYADDAVFAQVAPVVGGGRLTPYRAPAGSSVRAVATAAGGAFVLAVVGDDVIMYGAGNADPVAKLALPRGTTVFCMDVSLDGRQLALAGDSTLLTFVLPHPLVSAP